MHPCAVGGAICGAKILGLAYSCPKHQDAGATLWPGGCKRMHGLFADSVLPCLITEISDAGGWASRVGPSMLGRGL